MAGGAETPNIAALPAIARLGACESARVPDADRRVKLLIQFAVEGSHTLALIHTLSEDSGGRAACPILLETGIRKRDLAEKIERGIKGILDAIEDWLYQPAMKAG
jgi:hypothetical protein